MRKASKLWLGIGVAATVAGAQVVPPAGHELISSARAEEGGESGEKGSAGADAGIGFQGDLAHALGKIFAGEGGEGGAGLTTMWPRVSAPALTGEQIKTVVTDNTVRSDEHHALYFGKNGTLEGWYTTWAKGPDAKACPKSETAGDNFFRAGEDCYLKTIHQVSGPWEVRDHQVCVKLEWMQARQNPCWYVTILLDRVALFDASGKIEGKGNDLKRGKVLPQVAT